MRDRTIGALPRGNRTMKRFAAALLTSAALLIALPARAAEIAVIVKTVNSTFWQNVQKGAETAIKGVGRQHRDLPGPGCRVRRRRSGEHGRERG